MIFFISRKMRIVSAAILFIIMPFAAVAQGKGESVKFQDYPGLGNMLARVAISKGYCEKYGIKCSVARISTGPLGAQALVAKSIDAALIPADVMTPAILNGSKIKIIAGGATTIVALAVAGNHVETPNASKGYPAFMADMKGRKIGTPARGSNLERFAMAMLTKAGLKADDVTFVAVGGPDTAYGALVSKQVDFIFLFEPAGAMCDVLKTCKVLWRAITDKEPAEIFAMNGGGTSTVVRQEMIDQQPHVVDAIINALRDADAFFNNSANFKEVKVIAEIYNKFDFPKGDEVLERALSLQIEARTFSVGLDRVAMTSMLKFFADQKAIDRVLPVSDLVDPRTPNWVSKK
jgi:NitT/TauT family transport system substrate-binding protein